MAIWQQTCDLRRYDNTSKLTDVRLQQKWICRDDGKEEWRDVPLVWEKSKATADD